MSTNWAKDGLDAYLSMTGEHRAEQKAADDRAAQQHAQAIQDQQLQLAQNADTRAASTQGLSNKLTQQSIDEGDRKASDRAKFSSALQDYITIKTASNPSIPNSNDPTAMAASKQEAYDLAHTAEMLNQLPDGTAQSMQMTDLPPAAQKVLAEGPGKAAQARAGTEHKDPITGTVSVVTGELGPVHVVKQQGQPAVIMPTLLMKSIDPRGRVTYLEAPFTDNQTNASDDPVRTITPDMLQKRAGLQLSALNTAEQTGVSPTVAYAQSIYKMVNALPYEQQLSWYQTELQKESGRRDKYVTDAALAKSAEPYSKQLEALTGTPEEKRSQAAAIMIGAPSDVVDHLTKSSKAVHDLFPDSKKTFVTASTGGGIYSVDATTGERGAYIGPPTKVPSSGSSSDKIPAQIRSYQEWKKIYKGQGYSDVEAHIAAERAVQEAKANPEHDELNIASGLVKSGQVETLQDGVNQVRQVRGIPNKPAAMGLTVSRSPAASSFDMRNQGNNGMPKTGAEQILSLSGR